MQQRVVSFINLGELCFRDSMLLTSNASLKTAAESYGVEVKKGHLPHPYFQNCASAQELQDRLNGKVCWKVLYLYMDWFNDAKDKEFHKRVAGRTWEQWRDEQPLRKEFQPGKMCDFVQK